MTVEIEYSSLSPVASSQLANYAMKFEDVSMYGDDDERRDGLFSFFKGVGRSSPRTDGRPRERFKEDRRQIDRTFAQSAIEC